MGQAREPISDMFPMLVDEITLCAFACPVKPLSRLFHRGARPENNDVNCLGLQFHSAIQNWAEEKMSQQDSVRSLFDLSPPEKLQLVEDLWDDLAAAPSEVPVHEWQKEELAIRKTRLMSKPSSGLLWDEVKQRVRTRYGC